ncbi:GNAT family N-acetyltransferase [Litorilituus lipolyticus]|uniref:GNAT family N-acetyltransferase n=1 Tax=Litorilituus lipolyticus TaxID=2491017 RepID=A0A502L5I2_9GAMM|nr:GNAT family N-acetyltransferase [Litorilituus lipolyticus]TPH15557.1 GNAT family N-acetyltransferase [Litorilituus lipolyticus]
MNYSYHQLSIDEFDRLYGESLQSVSQFELTFAWLKATAQFMVPDGGQVIVHCLIESEASSQVEKLIVALPLMHLAHNKTLKSLGSFYSTIIAQSYSTYYQALSHTNALNNLITHILQSSSWQTLQIGPMEEDSGLANFFITQRSKSYFSKVFSQNQNIYQDKLSSFEHYYAQLPSQLKNTLSRRSKKLRKYAPYTIDIVTTNELFERAFRDYKTIYQASWKVDEYSYDFIEQVCRSALAKNQLRLGVLYVNDKPAAAQIWFIQANETIATASIFKLAYHPDFQQFSVGSILSLALSEYVLNRDMVNVIEFGMGNESYKRDWLKLTKKRLTLQVYNKRNILGFIKGVLSIWLARLKNIKTKNTQLKRNESS